MSELNKEIAVGYHEIADFLQVLAETGTWFEEPKIDRSRGELQFSFTKYDEGIPWSLTDEQRSLRTVDRFKAAAKTIGGRWSKNDPKAGAYDDMMYRFSNETRRVAGLTVVLEMNRDLVCERVQTGTEKVTVPAQPAVVEHVEERPVYERECKPLFTSVDRELNAFAREIEADTVVDAELVEEG